ncbi:hypothetical protein BJ741DRAFT_618407 [Chytriomyces cf. hyalinus JEL632]|nr:hypothetical protein BJ741DRAFT_618407 [Chytriomyces cf. hyalinus JEL632]
MQVRVKVEHNATVRQIVFDDVNTATWSHFVAEAKEAFQLSPNSTIETSYVDQDGDKITLDSDRDLQAHLRLQKVPKLYITLSLSANEPPQYLDPTVELSAGLGATRIATWTPPKISNGNGFPSEAPVPPSSAAADAKQAEHEKESQQMHDETVTGPDTAAVIDMLVDVVSADPDQMDRAIQILHELSVNSGVPFKELFLRLNDTLTANFPSYNPEYTDLPPRYTTVYSKPTQKKAHTVHEKDESEKDDDNVKTPLADEPTTPETTVQLASIPADGEMVTIHHKPTIQSPPLPDRPPSSSSSWLSPTPPKRMSGPPTPSKLASTVAPASLAFTNSLKSALTSAQSAHNKNEAWILEKLQAAQNAACPVIDPLIGKENARTLKTDATNMFKFASQAGSGLLQMAASKFGGSGAGGSSHNAQVEGYRSVVSKIAKMDIAKGVERSRIEMLAVEFDGNETDIVNAIKRDQ